MFSSSYTEEGLKKIEEFVTKIDPKVAVEIGTQQGTSATAIMKGMQKGTSYGFMYPVRMNPKLYVCDLFSETYPNPPYAKTHASLEKTLEVLQKQKEKSDRVGYEVYRGLYENLILEMLPWDYENIELVHIDICNHKDNLQELLFDIRKPILKLKNLKGLILEGGRHNNWQKKYDYKPYTELLEVIAKQGWGYNTISFNEHNAITFLEK